MVGEEDLEKLNTFHLKEEDKNDDTKVIKAFGKFCLPRSNESVNRHIFFAKAKK